MNRNTFLQSGAAALLGGMIPAWATARPPFDGQASPLLNAYYFRAHMYTLVPRQVREDMKWMAGLGTQAVSIAVLEQDLFAGVENIAFICEEAERAGMQVFAVPSRWGGMLAGAPKVPSLFSITHPETYILQRDGRPHPSSVSGRISSVYHPATYAFFCESLKSLLSRFPIRGIVWDEPKVFVEDHSPAATAVLGPDPSYAEQMVGAAAFFSRVNAYIKQEFPAISTHLFVYAHVNDTILYAAAHIKDLDYFGCDGRPWYPTDQGTAEGEGKTLLGAEAGERFLPAARQAGKKSLWLIENHNLQAADLPLMEKRLPQVLAQPVDQFIYYYYPRNMERPQATMKVLRRALRGLF